jgi:hypothetical protein
MDIELTQISNGLASLLTKTSCINDPSHYGFWTALCTSPNCALQFLCAECLISQDAHTKTHSPHIIGIDNYFSTIFLEALKMFTISESKVKEMGKFLENLNEIVRDQYYEVYTSFIKDTNSYLKKIFEFITEAVMKVRGEVLGTVNRHIEEVQKQIVGNFLG